MYRPHCVRSVLTTSVKILSYRPPARLIRANCEQKLQVQLYIIITYITNQRLKIKITEKYTCINSNFFKKIKLNAFRGEIFIHPMTCVKLFRFEGCVDILVATQFRPCDDSFGRLQLYNLYGCMYEQSNCNLPNDSSHDLNWMPNKDVNC